MKTVPITGSEPFGGESVNPSWEVVLSLDNVIIDGCRVIARQLPCIFGESLAVLNAAADALSSPLVLAVGQAGGRMDITVERVATDVDDACTVDNQGQQLVDVPIVVDGPTAWSSSSPIKAMVVAMRNTGVPASVSQTVDTFVCNHATYGLLHKLRDVPAVKSGFIHIPYLSQQAVQHPGAPGIATEMVRRALEIAIVTTLQMESDIAVTGGAAH